MNAGNNTTEQRQKYLKAIQEAILGYLGDLEQKDQDIFLYKGLNLRSAVQRKLYFKYLNHSEAFNTYCSAPNAPLSLLPWESIGAKSTQRKQFLRKLRAFAMKPAPAANHKPIILFASNNKHLRYARKLLQEGEFSSASFSKESGAEFDLSAMSKSSIPNLKKASELLSSNHYDLLVELESMLTLLKASDCKTAVTIEGNTPQDDLMALAAKQTGKQSYCLQYGWSFTPHLGFQNTQADNFLSWGRAFSDVLSPLNSQTQFLEKGHPLLEQQGSKQAEENAGKTTVSAIMQAAFGHAGQDTFDQFNQSLFKLLDLGINVLVREHPSHPLPSSLKQEFGKAGATLINPKEMPLMEQLSMSQYTYTMFSSVGFEAMIANNIVVFGLFGLKLDFQPDLMEKGLAYSVHSNAQLITLLTQLEDQKGRGRIAHLSEQKKQLEYFFPATGQDAIQRIRAELIQPS